MKVYSVFTYMLIGTYTVRIALDLSERSFSLDRAIAVNIVIMLFVLLTYGSTYGCIRFQMRWINIERALAPQWNLCSFRLFL